MLGSTSLFGMYEWAVRAHYTVMTAEHRICWAFAYAWDVILVVSHGRERQGEDFQGLVAVLAKTRLVRLERGPSRLH